MKIYDEEYEQRKTNQPKSGLRVFYDDFGNETVEKPDVPAKTRKKSGPKKKKVPTAAEIFALDVRREGSNEGVGLKLTVLPLWYCTKEALAKVRDARQVLANALKDGVISQKDYDFYIRAFDPTNNYYEEIL